MDESGTGTPAIEIGEIALEGDGARIATFDISFAVTTLVVVCTAVAAVLTSHGVAAAAWIEVPSEHIDAGLVEASANFPGALGVRPILKIHSSRNAPDRANVAVQHRGWWFYVDDTDLTSKRMFQRIQMLFLTRLSEATRGTQTTPLLTIPVK